MVHPFRYKNPSLPPSSSSSSLPLFVAAEKLSPCVPVVSCPPWLPLPPRSVSSTPVAGSLASSPTTMSSACACPLARPALSRSPATPASWATRPPLTRRPCAVKLAPMPATSTALAKILTALASALPVSASAICPLTLPPLELSSR
ncbi:hypothetical protein B0H65DRAFT_21673 [Neurospora tetraspora]|uniref:Uncharacterized protein n=1 Tax=Neurospora tetraspora TaxID=94610 RepID=A0AAE0JNU7_9PEZI|nr:hypothetical protein B0H65DRAFT_21673 [Neurospora tetraspora]